MKKKGKPKIVHPARKLVFGILLALILTGVLWMILLIINIMSTQQFVNLINYYSTSGEENNKNSDKRFDGILGTCDEIARDIDEAVKEYYDQWQCKVDLSSRACFEMVSEQGDAAIGKLGQGAIIKVEDGEVILSDGIRSGIRNYPEIAEQPAGRLDYITPTMSGNRIDTLFFSRIKGPYYYVEIVDGREMLKYLDKYVNYDEIFAGIENAYGVMLYIVCPDRENSRYFYNLNGDLIYYYGKAYEDRGIDTNNTEDYKFPASREELLALDGEMTPGGDMALSYIVREVPSLDAVLIVVADSMDAFSKAIDETAAGVMVILILTITFVVWAVSVYKEMTQGLITDKKKEMYAPGRMRIIALSCGVLGAIIVFGASVFFRSLNNIFLQITDNQDKLSVIDERISNNADYLEKRINSRRSLYLDYAKRTAELIEKNPQLNNKEDLQAINKIIGAEYIILFDSEGRQTGTSSDYINMELGREDADHPVSSADFRRLLKGVPGIAHSAFKDEVTGRVLEQYGVRMKEGATGKYGALIIAVEPANDDENFKSINGILRSLTPAGMLSFMVNPKTGVFTYSMSDEFLEYYYFAKDLGLGDSIIRDGVSDFARIEGVKYLVVSKKAEDGNIIFLCTPNDMLFSKGFRYGFVCAVGFLVVFALLSLYLLRGYTDRLIAELEKKVPPEKTKSQDEENTEEMRDELPHSRLGSVIMHITGNATPEKKTLVVFEVMLALTFIRMFINARSGKVSQEKMLLEYVLTGKWNKGLNIFSLTSIVMLFCALLLGMMFVRFFMNTLGRMLGSRGKTICRLISNMINYVGILVFIYYALSYLGVDTNAILASVGVIGIGVSMGARDLIADIFAGVSMIFEGEYQVGDIVNIDGYRGMVQEVGVRSTRLIGRGGNVKVIGNKDIKSVTNLTKMNSWVAITIKVDVNYAIRDAEEIINRTLPQIAAKHHEIISGPYYKGILSVEMGFAVLSIIAECNEDDYHKVERTLVREVLLALRENNVPVR